MSTRQVRVLTSCREFQWIAGGRRRWLAFVLPRIILVQRLQQQRVLREPADNEVQQSVASEVGYSERTVALGGAECNRALKRPIAIAQKNGG
jgi:hypothetical protein